MPMMSRVFQGFCAPVGPCTSRTGGSIGAVVANDLVGVDDVAAALGHLEAAGVDRDRGIALEDVIRAGLVRLLLRNTPADQLLAGFLVNA